MFGAIVRTSPMAAFIRAIHLKFAGYIVQDIINI